MNVCSWWWKAVPSATMAWARGRKAASNWAECVTKPRARKGQPWVLQEAWAASCGPFHMVLHSPSRCEKDSRVATHRAELSLALAATPETETPDPRGCGCCTSEAVRMPLQTWSLGTCTRREPVATLESETPALAALRVTKKLPALRGWGCSRSAGSSLVTRRAASDHGSTVLSRASAAASPRSRACSAAPRPSRRSA